MKKILFSFGFVVFLFPAFASAQQVDSSCLVLWQDSPLFPGPGYGWQNSDSVKVDMCQGPQYLAEFAKHGFVVPFQYFIMPHYDTIARTWMEIDTQYSSIRAEFDTLEQLLGSFKLQLYDYDTIRMVNDPGDTSLMGDDLWFVNFENYVNIDTALYYLKKLPELNTFSGVFFEGRPGFFEGINENISPISIHVWPQPCSGELLIEEVKRSDKILMFDPLGRQLSLPTSSTDGVMTIDVSKQPNGIFYVNVSGQFFKILIQK